MNRIKHITLLLAVCLIASMALVSCSADSDMGRTIDKRAGKAQVRFVVKTPPPMRAATRAADEAFENTVNDITIFVFKSDGEGGFIGDYLLPVETFTTVNPTTTVFTAALDASETPVKLLILANTTEMLSSLFDTMYDNPLVFESYTESQIRELYTGYIARADLQPFVMTMTGEKELTAVDPELPAIDIEVPMLRCVARVDLQLDLGEDSRDFVPEEVWVYRTNVSVHLFPDSRFYDNPDNPSRVTAPSAPLKNPYNYEFTMDGTTGLFSTGYITESVSPETLEERVAEATCLVVGGRFNGSETTTYYRVDFNSGEPGHPFGQVLRNHKYIFNITKVTAPGYPNPDDAANNPANSMEMHVTAWSENISEVHFVDTGDYIMVNTNSLILPYNNGGTQTFVVRSTQEFEWQLGDDGTVVSSELTTPVTNVHYSVTVSSFSPSESYTDYTFTVEALGDNFDSDVDNAMGLFIMLRDATLSVELTQAAAGTSDEKINVLSLTDGIGSMDVCYMDNGEASGEVSTAGLAPELRPLLCNPEYFGPGSEYVDFDGFTFDIYQTLDISATTNVGITQFNRALENTDILIMPYSSNPNQATVDAILQWLDASNDRVLFLSCDAGIDGDGVDTNVIMRQQLNADGDGMTWHSIETLGSATSLLGIVGDLLKGLLDALVGGFLDWILSGTTTAHVDGLVMATPLGPNEVFISGPFGTANQNQIAGGIAVLDPAYDMWDGIAEWGYVGEGSPVIPLAVFQVTTTTTPPFPISLATDPHIETMKVNEMMLVGVDPNRRIVYLGETQLVHGYMDVVPNIEPGIAGTPGLNNITTLMCNTWAWAVNTVLSGR